MNDHPVGFCLYGWNCVVIHTFGHILIQIKIREDRKSQPLLVLRPYDGLPVYSSTFVTAPNKPDHIIVIILITVAWKCTQTLELKRRDHLPNFSLKIAYLLH